MKISARRTGQAAPRLRPQVRILVGDEIALGPGKADLLDAVHATGSISAAGRKLGMSYRRAWLLIDTMNRCFDAPLVATAAGGMHGGGAALTAEGGKVLRQYRAMLEEVASVAGRHFRALKPLLREKPRRSAR